MILLVILITVNEIRIRLQSSAVYGMDLVSADVFQYAGAGVEKVMDVEDATVGGTTNPIKCYTCTDQAKLTLDKTAVLDSGQQFDFEKRSTYTCLFSFSYANGYLTEIARGTRIGRSKKGGSADNTAYLDRSSYATQPVGKRVRLGHRVRGYGFGGVCSARALTAISAASHAGGAFAGGFQVRLPEGTPSETVQNVSDESVNE